MIAFDTETFLIGPDAIAPKVVCASFAEPDKMPKVIGNSVAQHLDVSLWQMFERHESVGHRVCYDLAVICATFPWLMALVFKALDEGRIHCTQIRDMLYVLGTSGFLDGTTGWSLAAIAKRRVGLDLSAGKDKENVDLWRVNYHKLDGMHSRDYPQEAYDYAALDAQATLEVWQDQEKHSKFFKTESLHVRAAFCLELMTAWGLKIDKPAKEKLQAEVEAALDPAKLPLLYSSGLVTPAQPARPAAKRKVHVEACKKKGCDCPLYMLLPQEEKTKVKDVLHPLIEQVCSEQGFVVKKTKKGKTCADAEVLKALAPFNPILKQYQERAEWIKLKTSYLPALEWPFASGVTADTVHPHYTPLKKTGRVSSKGNTKSSKNPLYPSVAIQLADPRVRGVYAPRPGMVYAICDFSAIDLCALAQTTYDLYGHSTLRDQINAGIDPHSFLGAVLAYEGDDGFRDSVEPFKSDDTAVYEHFLSKKGEDPDWFKHWRTFAKPVGLGYPGGMGLSTMVQLCGQYGIAITKKDARRLKHLWLSVYPEMNHYLKKWVESQNKRYVSPMGMIRAGCSYTELANGRALQTPAAEGMKEAMWLVTRACYDPDMDDILLGSRPVLNMHDELVVEIPDDDLIHERATHMSDLMVAGMKKVLPDVAIRAEPCVSRKWVKEAETVRDANGRLLIWEG